MILNKHDLDKVRPGLYRCTRCGDYYDPTTYGKTCPHCGNKCIYLATALFMLFLFWLPLEAGAQVGPVPTAVPTVAAAPTIEPLAQCAEITKRHCVWLPIGAN